MVGWDGAEKRTAHHSRPTLFSFPLVTQSFCTVALNFKSQCEKVLIHRRASILFMLRPSLSTVPSGNSSDKRTSPHPVLLLKPTMMSGTVWFAMNVQKHLVTSFSFPLSFSFPPSFSLSFPLPPLVGKQCFSE